MQGGVDVCITVTLLDGLVLARSGYHHDMNYRSVNLGQAGPSTQRSLTLMNMKMQMCCLHKLKLHIN